MTDTLKGLALTRLYLPYEIYQAMLAQTRDAAPEECLGLLFGVGDRVYRHQRISNCAEDKARRYYASPEELLQALKAADANSEDLVALYHSHPLGPPYPSATDQREARYDVPNIIISLPTLTIRAFYLRPQICELDLIVFTSSGSP